MPIGLLNLGFISQILRTIERHTVAAQDAAITLFDLLTLQDNYLAIGTFEAKVFILGRLDKSNQILEVPDIASLYPVDHQHFNIVVTLIHAIANTFCKTTTSDRVEVQISFS